VIDIADWVKLGMFTYDPAFRLHHRCSSSITFIDAMPLLYTAVIPSNILAEKVGTF